MSEDRTRPRWAVLPGGSLHGAKSGVPTLHVVPYRVVPRIQLGFAFPNVARQTAISLAYDGLTRALFEQLLSTFRPKALLDIRFSPSFNSDTLKRETVVRLVQTYSVKYQHVYALANHFLGEDLDPRWSLEKYARALTDNPAIALVREAIASGPVLLLSNRRDHAQSERAILLDEVARRWPAFRFDLQIVD